MSFPKLELADTNLHKIRSSVSKCYLGKLYFLGFRRSNRFGPSTLFTEGEIGSLYPSLQAVEHVIQPLRRKGTYWEAIDVPTVVIEAEDDLKLLIVGDGWGGNTLAGFNPTLPPQRKFGHLAKALMAQLPKDAWALQWNQQVEPASFPFGQNRSVPRTVLTWRREWWPIDPRSAIRLVAAICTWLAETPPQPS